MANGNGVEKNRKYKMALMAIWMCFAVVVACTTIIAIQGGTKGNESLESLGDKGLAAVVTIVLGYLGANVLQKATPFLKSVFKKKNGDCPEETPALATGDTDGGETA